MNAKTEFIKHVEGKAKVAAASVLVSDQYGDVRKKIVLYDGYDSNEFIQFMKDINFEYDDDHEYSNTLIAGVIWYEDGSWSERIQCGHCLFSEWLHKTMPSKPVTVRKINAKKEFLSHIGAVEQYLKSAKVIFTDCDMGSVVAELFESHAHSDLDVFLNKLNGFEYYQSNVAQYITGTIWFEDGSYSTHEDFGNGVEKWVYHENGCSCRFCECKIVWGGAFYFKDLNP